MEEDRCICCGKVDTMILWEGYNGRWTYSCKICGWSYWVWCSKPYPQYLAEQKLKKQMEKEQKKEKQKTFEDFY